MSQPFAQDFEFRKLCSGCDEVDLVDLMLELAADAYPQLDREASRSEIARLQSIAASRLAHGPADLADRLHALGELIYVNEGFRGNRQQYYDPRNSYLNEVLGRRCGIPITLGIVYMAVASGADVEVRGVPAPGHFMLVAGEQAERLFVDPFNGGEVFGQDECRRRVADMLSGQDGPSGDWLRPASNFEIVVRVLRNLKAAYAMDDTWRGALHVQQRICALLPEKSDEQRDLALIYLRNGQPHPALKLLEGYLEVCDEEATGLMQPYLRTARKMVAELN